MKNTLRETLVLHGQLAVEMIKLCLIMHKVVHWKYFNFEAELFDIAFGECEDSCSCSYCQSPQTLLQWPRFMKMVRNLGPS